MEYNTVIPEPLYRRLVTIAQQNDMTVDELVEQEMWRYVRVNTQIRASDLQ